MNLVTRGLIYLVTQLKVYTSIYNRWGRCPGGPEAWVWFPGRALTQPLKSYCNSHCPLQARIKWNDCISKGNWRKTSGKSNMGTTLSAVVTPKREQWKKNYRWSDNVVNMFLYAIEPLISMFFFITINLKKCLIFNSLKLHVFFFFFFYIQDE